MNTYIIHFTKAQEKILLPLLASLEVDFESLPTQEATGVSSEKIADAFNNCAGMWKDRKELQDIKKFRKTLWRKNQNP